ncbi:MAG: Ig-like domain-containing protein, partial [Bacteroidales bacterium]|nr:Ig-like domain-containing protein [Bacteroidales bacterium]
MFLAFTFSTCKKEIPVVSVSLSQTSTTLTVGSTQQLSATISPADATNKEVTWSSSASNVAAVSSLGLVTAVAAGSATITVTTVDGNKTATCTVTVSVSVTGVTISPTSVTMTVGGTQQLTA